MRRTRACWKARKKHCVHKKVCFFKFELSPTYPAKRPPPPHAHRHSLPYTVPRTRGGLGCGGEAPAGTPAKFGVICPSRFGDIRRGFPAPPPPTATHSAPPTAGLPASVCDACVRVGKPAPNCRATRCKSFIQFNPPPLIRRNVPHPPTRTATASPTPCHAHVGGGDGRGGPRGAPLQSLGRFVLAVQEISGRECPGRGGEGESAGYCACSPQTEPFPCAESGADNVVRTGPTTREQRWGQRSDDTAGSCHKSAGSWYGSEVGAYPAGTVRPPPKHA